VYLQSTIQFTTKLYLAYDIQRGSLTPPEMENANIRQIGKTDEESNEVKNGIRYRVVKRLYAITPQRSGTYSITAPIFNGELVVNKRRSFFSGFNNTKPISLIGDSIEITVKPIPDEYSGQWLPSELVVLAEEWQSDNGAYKVGDPITRIITLNAIGVSEEQLPELTIDYPADVKAYPDQSTLNSATRNNQLFAQRKDSVALVPGKAGQLTFPEVRVPWWNTRTNTMEYATLPAKTVTIEPSDNPIDIQPVAIQAPAIVPIGNPGLETITIKEVQVNSYLTWTFLAAWILTALFWLVHIRHLKNKGLPAKVVLSNSGPSERADWSDFEAACKADDPIKANQQLQRWGRACWPEKSFTSSMEVASFLGSKDVIAEVNELQKHLYGAQSNKWQGKTLLSVTSKNKSPKTVKNSDGLQPLHPA
ncbi:MAG: hypothetical protein MJK04_12300, partial [Psychrosphaera sp.]|nr:hypothetical protein [Psychrosphaera sp.]